MADAGQSVVGSVRTTCLGEQIHVQYIVMESSLSRCALLFSNICVCVCVVCVSYLYVLIVYSVQLDKESKEKDKVKKSTAEAGKKVGVNTCTYELQLI